MKVTADRDICMATGMCVMTADVFFDQDEDGVVLLISDAVPDTAHRAVTQAVKLCPSGALQLVPE